MSELWAGSDDPRILRAFSNPATAADNPIIAAVANRKIKVLAGSVVNNVATANTLIWKSNANIIGPSIVLPASLFGYVPYPYNEAGWLITNLGEALNLNLSAATAVGVQVIYILV